MKDDGTYTEIYRKWFEEDPPDRIFDVRAQKAA